MIIIIMCGGHIYIYNVLTAVLYVRHTESILGPIHNHRFLK